MESLAKLVALLVTGLLGGFTTFSAFSLETGVLWERAPWLAVVYVAASVLGGLAAFGVCYWGVNIIFVPFWTDTKSSFLRVQKCAAARAIENECYVAIAGSVGNLPKVIAKTGRGKKKGRQVKAKGRETNLKNRIGFFIYCYHPKFTKNINFNYVRIQIRSNKGCGWRHGRCDD